MMRTLARLAAPLSALCLFAVGVRADDSAAPSWQPVGWGGGGFFWCAVYHPTDDNVIYLGGDVGGIYKTEDRGRQWRFVNNGLADYGVYCLAISRSDPETLYAMTQGGLCKTTDGARSWRFLEGTGKGDKGQGLDLSADRPNSVRAVAIDPTDSEVVYAGNRQGKLHKSADGGTTWRKLSYLPDPADQPRETPPAFTGTGSLVLTYESEAGDWSKNGRAEKGFNPPGIDWTRYRKVTARFRVPDGAPRLQAQAVVQSGPNWLWQQGPWVEGKPGEWTEVALDLAGLKDLATVHFVYFVVRSPEAGYQGEVYLDAVALHTSAESTLAPGQPAEQAGVVILGDWERPGDTEGWRANRKIKDALFVTQLRQSSDPPLKEKGVISSVAVAESDPNTLFVSSTEYGILKSADAGDTWARLKTPKGALSVTVSPHDADVVFAAFGSDGIRKSADGGATWTAANAGLRDGCVVREVAVDPKDPDRVHAIAWVNWDGDFYTSTDAGATWQSSRTVKRDFDADPTCPQDYGGRQTGTCPLSRPTNLTLSPTNPDHLFVSANWRPCFSPDGGATWEERSRGADITCVTDIRFHGGKVYVTAMDEGLLVSEDGGATWRQLCPLEYDTTISGHQWRVHVRDHGDTQKIITTCSPWEEPQNRVLVSEDGGRTFRAFRDGLPDYRPTANTMWGQSYPRALAVDPANPDVLYLGMDGDPQPDEGLGGGGIFKSADGAQTWQQLPGQPGSRRVFYGLAVDPTDSQRLYWAASGAEGGLYRSEDGGGSWQCVLSNERWVFNVVVSPAGVVYCPGSNLWRSTDHGATWRKLTGFPSGLPIVGLAIDPRDEDTIWLSRVTWGTNAEGGVFKSADGGETWSEITGDLPYRKPTVLRFDPATNELWAGGVGLFKTSQ